MVTYTTTTNVRRETNLDTTVISDDDIEEFILDAEAEVDNWTGKKYESTEYTEYQEGSPRQASITGTVDEGVYSDVPVEEQREILLEHYPVISITSLTTLDDNGDTADTLTENTHYHLFKDTGKIWIYSGKIPYGDNKKKVKIVYNAGTETVPRVIQKLTSVIAGIHALVYQMGGTYNDVTSYTLPEGISVSLGEPYTQIRETLNRLEKERDRLFKMIGREIRVVVV